MTHVSCGSYLVRKRLSNGKKPPQYLPNLESLNASEDELLNRAPSASKYHSGQFWGPLRMTVETVPRQMSSQLPLPRGGLCGPSRKPVETVRTQMASHAPAGAEEHRAG